MGSKNEEENLSEKFEAVLQVNKLQWKPAFWIQCSSHYPGKWLSTLENWISAWTLWWWGSSSGILQFHHEQIVFSDAITFLWMVMWTITIYIIIALKILTWVYPITSNHMVWLYDLEISRDTMNKAHYICIPKEKVYRCLRHRKHLIFHQDGAPAHFQHNVRVFLDEKIPKWQMVWRIWVSMWKLCAYTLPCYHYGNVEHITQQK
jgi:hypothetical protein